MNSVVLFRLVSLFFWTLWEENDFSSCFISYHWIKKIAVEERERESGRYLFWHLKWRHATSVIIHHPLNHEIINYLFCLKAGLQPAFFMSFLKVEKRRFVLSSVATGPFGNVIMITIVKWAYIAKHLFVFSRLFSWDHFIIYSSFYFYVFRFGSKDGGHFDGVDLWIGRPKKKNAGPNRLGLHTCRPPADHGWFDRSTSASRHSSPFRAAVAYQRRDGPAGLVVRRRGFSFVLLVIRIVVGRAWTVTQLSATAAAVAQYEPHRFQSPR